MAVKIKKDEIDIREKLNELDRPVGKTGLALLASDTPKTANEVLGTGRRNFIINGDMSVWQRGTSFSGTGADQTYSADRWTVSFFDDVNTRSVSRSTIAPEGFSYSMELLAGDDQLYPVTTVELPRQGDAGPFGFGKWFTLSFYTDADEKDIQSTSPANYLLFRNTVNAGDSVFATPDDQRLELIEDDCGNGFRRYAVTVQIQARPHPNNIVLTVAPRFYVSQGRTFRLTGVQLEEGTCATPYMHRLPGEELALCQRYYQTHTVLGAGCWNSASTFFAASDLPVSMRINPTVGTKSGVLSNINIEYNDVYNVTGIAVQHGSGQGSADVTDTTKFVVTLSFNGTMTAGEAGVAVCDRNNDYFTFDAEIPES